MIGKTARRSRKRPSMQQSNKVARYTEYYKSQKQDVVVNTSKDPFKTKRSPTRNIQKHARSLPTYGALLLIVLSLLYASMLSGDVRIVMGTQTGLYTKESYEQRARQLLGSSIANKTKISLDIKAYKNKLLEDIPEFQDVQVSVPIIGKNVTVGVTFVEPAFLYEQRSDVYVLGANGKILGLARDVVSAESIATLRTIKDMTPISVKPGQTVLLATDVTFMQTVFSELERSDLKARTAILPQGAGELHIELQDKAYKVKFSLLGDARQQVGAFLATVQSLGDAAPQEYVDVRLSERVFVK